MAPKPKDFTLTLQTVCILFPALASIAPLSPPPKASGRQILSRAFDQAEAEFKRIVESEQTLLKKYAKYDEKGAVIRPLVFETPENETAFKAEQKALLEMTKTFTDLRTITREELGDCPITVGDERALVMAGLLARA